MKVTIQAIADLAGVSRATVDKVIHNRPGVSDAVREQIKTLILETNYQPVHIRKFLKESRSKIHIAVIMPELQDPFMTLLKAGMDDFYLTYQAYGLTIDYFYCSSYDPQQMINILNHLREKPIDAVALRGIRSETINSLIDDFSRRGIPVFTFDADLPNSKRISFIGEDHYRTGQISASLLCKSIGYKGEVAILTGAKNVNSCLERINGFSAYLKERAPEVHIVSVAETLSQHLITYQKTISIINKHPNLKGMWNCVCHSEDMAQAVIDSGNEGKIKLVSLIFTPEVIRFIKEGTIDYTIGLMPRTLGKMTIRTIYEYLISNVAPSPVNIRPPIHIGCNANIDIFENDMQNIF
ncbi:MAG: substrate-binding domain-containing protein [Ruminococcus sp.]|jgi:LacI family transcriptional regulator